MSDIRQPVIPRLMLDTKANIPFPAAQLTIVQPSIKDISLLGEESNFLVSVNALTKNYRAIKDNFDLSQLSNFEIFMTMMMEKDANVQKIKQDVEQMLSLLFPNHQIMMTPQSIILMNEEKKSFLIDANNFDAFADIIYDMFCLRNFHGDDFDDYNPGGDRARALVEKFRKKRELLAELKRERGENSSLMSVLERYISILAVGERKDKNQLAEYSVFQLVDEFKRFQLKETFDFTFQAKMAGAQKIKDAKDWMGDIQFGDDKED
jgi:hypothetical protein